MNWSRVSAASLLAFSVSLGVLSLLLDLDSLIPLMVFSPLQALEAQVLTPLLW